MGEVGAEPRWVARAAWIGLALAVLGAAAIRIRLLDVPLERDEGEYAYIGALMLDGVPPYAGAYTMKLPGAPATLALAMAVFGRTIAGVRIGLLLVSATTTLLVFLLARRLWGNLGAFAASAAFAGITVSTALLGIYAHATQFVLLFAVAGLLVLVPAARTARPARLFAAGVLFGTAILMKQQGAVFAAGAVAWIAGLWWSASPRAWRALAVRALALTAGVLTPLAATAAALEAAGTLDNGWFWTVEYARRYASYASLGVGAARLGRRLLEAGPQLWGFGVLALAGAAVLIAPGAGRRDRAFLGGLLLFSFAGVATGLYFRPHYLLLMAPIVAFLAGVAAERAGRKAPALAVLAIILAFGQTVWAQRRLFFQATPTEVSRALFTASPFPEAIEVARYLRERAAPGDTVAVLGSEPEIPFYSGLRSATGHIYMYGLMEAHSFARAMQAQMIAEIEHARPRFVVYVRTDSSWDRAVFSQRLIFDWMDRYLPVHYRKVGQVDIVGPEETRYLWDEDVVGADILSTTHLVVLQRVEVDNPLPSAY